MSDRFRGGDIWIRTYTEWIATMKSKPAIIVTGHGDVGSRKEGQWSRASACLGNPFSLAEIKQLVKAIANRSI